MNNKFPSKNEKKKKVGLNTDKMEWVLSGWILWPNLFHNYSNSSHNAGTHRNKKNFALVHSFMIQVQIALRALIAFEFI